MIFRYIILAFIVVAIGACSDKVSKDVDPSNGGGGGISVTPGWNDPSNDPSNDDQQTLQPNKGDVVDFKWQQTLPWYYESDEHQYGFDKDPLSQVEGFAENGKFVYLSVLKGQNASVILKVDPNAKDIVKLNAIDDMFHVVSTIFTGSQLCESNVCKTTLSLPAGTYAIYYGDVDKERYLKVVEYPQRIVPGLYYQFDGDIPCLDAGCYSFDDVKDNFDRVFGQAVLTNGFEQVDPNEYGYDQVMTVDMTNPINSNFVTSVAVKLYDRFYPGYEAAYHFVSDIIEGAEGTDGEPRSLDGIYADEWNSYVECKKNNSCSYTDEQVDELLRKYSTITTNRSILHNGRNSLYGKRFVFALNTTRFMWRLVGSVPGGNVVINNYSDLIPLFFKYDGKSADMYLKSLSSACGESAIGLTPKKVKVVLVGTNGNAANIRITDGNGNSVSFDSDCDYVYTDEMTHVPGTVRGTVKAYSSAAQVTLPLRDDNDVVDGGFVWSGKQDGEASQNTLQHEIGHTLGLTDAFINYIDGTVPYTGGQECYRGLSNGSYEIVPCNDVYTEKSAFHTGWTTKEADLMNYKIPSGPRLRFRAIPVVQTGTNIRLRDESGNIIYESQWECVQNKTCNKK